ncbi:transcription initiation factor IIB [Candidatus Bathyarchaeota archaeon]|nr:MAG: transcription initiation factor IIB [Candidatus Bathyarchaeota archaeon]
MENVGIRRETPIGEKETRGLAPTTCPECGSTNIIVDYERGEMLCGDCGFVLNSSIMNRGPEWRAFTPQEQRERTRVGLPTSYSIHDKGLSTVISKIYRDASGRRLPLKTRIKMLRLRRWQIRSKVYSSRSRNLSRAMTEIDRLASQLNVPPQLQEMAALVYRKALEKDLVRGRSIAAIAAASLYAICRQTGTPRTLKEIAKVSMVSRKEMARCYRLLVEKLDMIMPIDDPTKCVPKIASKLGISEKCQQMAIEILKKAQETRFSTGKHPMGLAATALYMACKVTGERRTQREIADAAEVTEVTIRNRYNDLKDFLPT